MQDPHGHRAMIEPPTDPRSQGEEYVVGWYFGVAPGDGKHEYSDGGEVSHESREKLAFECCMEGWVGVGKRGPASGGVHGDVGLCTAKPSRCIVGARVASKPCLAAILQTVSLVHQPPRGEKGGL